jgi:hypothetical protein
MKYRDLRGIQHKIGQSTGDQFLLELLKLDLAVRLAIAEGRKHCYVVIADDKVAESLLQIMRDRGLKTTKLTYNYRLEINYDFS